MGEGVSKYWKKVSTSFMNVTGPEKNIWRSIVASQVCISYYQLPLKGRNCDCTDKLARNINVTILIAIVDFFDIVDDIWHRPFSHA